MAAETIKTLDKKIRATLEHDARINLHTSDIKLKALEKRIILEGLVDDIPSKRIAATTVAWLLGKNFTLEDHLCVQTTKLEDGELRDKVAKVLLEEAVFDNCSIMMNSNSKIELMRDVGRTYQDIIKASVNDGIVTLSGQVNSLTHRRIAEVLMWWISGCRRVDNLLRVVPEEEDSDGELADAVRMILEKDPFIDASQVLITVDTGEVDLSGQLSSMEQVDIAVSDTWAVPGVRDVNNMISVGHGLI